MLLAASSTLEVGSGWRTGLRDTGAVWFLGGQPGRSGGGRFCCCCLLRHLEKAEPRLLLLTNSSTFCWSLVC